MRRISIFFAVWITFFHSVALAQDPPTKPDSAPSWTDGTFFWDLDDAKEVEKGLIKALGADIKNHLFGSDDLAKKLAARQVDVPACFRGVEACTSPYAMVFDAFDLDGVVRINKIDTGFRYALIDRRQEVVFSGDVNDPDAAKASFEIVAKLFDATGTVVIETVPPEAMVTIGDEGAKKAPRQERLKVGSYPYTIEKNGYEKTAGTVEIGSGGVTNLRVELKVVPAVVRFTDATEGAEVFVNGMLAGPASEPLELEPGNYTIEVRKEGFRSSHEAVQVEAGQVVTRSGDLESGNFFLRDVSIEAIAHRKYHLRLAFEHNIQRATFQDARTSDGARFVGLADDSGELPVGDPQRQLVHANGVRFGAFYQLRHVGLALMSASFVTGSPDREGFVDNGTDRNVAVNVDRSNRLQIRPFQLNYRQFFSNFVPMIELGIGIDFHWFKATRSDNGETLNFRRVESFWTLGFTGNYFITNNLFGFAKYGYQDYFTSGPGADHLFNIGVGFSFGNLLGFDPEPPEQL